MNFNFCYNQLYMNLKIENTEVDENYFDEPNLMSVTGRCDKEPTIAEVDLFVKNELKLVNPMEINWQFDDLQGDWFWDCEATSN